MQLRRLEAQHQKSLMSMTKILKGGGRFWDDFNGGYLPEDLMLTARREEIEWVRFEGVYEILLMQECKVANKKLLDLIWVAIDKSVDPTRKKIRTRLCAREYKTKSQLLNCSLQCHLSKR